jgi:hypothetical protein
MVKSESLAHELNGSASEHARARLLSPEVYSPRTAAVAVAEVRSSRPPLSPWRNGGECSGRLERGQTLDPARQQGQTDQGRRALAGRCLTRPVKRWTGVDAACSDSTDQEEGVRLFYTCFLCRLPKNEAS